MRRLIARFILDHQDLKVQDLPIETVILTENANIEEYITIRILTDAEEAQTLVQNIMPYVLRIGTTIVIFDVKDKTVNETFLLLV